MPATPHRGQQTASVPRIWAGVACMTDRTTTATTEGTTPHDNQTTCNANGGHPAAAILPQDAAAHRAAASRVDWPEGAGSKPRSVQRKDAPPTDPTAKAKLPKPWAP